MVDKPTLPDAVEGTASGLPSSVSKEGRDCCGSAERFRGCSANSDE